MNERQQKILEILETQGTVSITALNELFGCSKVTLRNDIRSLKSQGLLERTRGGVKRAAQSASADLSREDYQFFFIPSYTALERASKSPVRDSFMLGAQNMCWEAEGQFTGEISPVMLKEFGVELALIGHSERRHTFGETDVTENKKVLKALDRL